MKNLKVLGRRSVSLLLALAMCLSMTLSVFADSNLGIPESGVPAVEGSSVPADPASVPAAPENSNTDGLNTDNGEPLVIPETDPDNGDVDPTPVVEQHLVTVNHVFEEVSWYTFVNPGLKLVNTQTNAEYEMTYNGNVASAVVPAGSYIMSAAGSPFNENIDVSNDSNYRLSSFAVGMFDGSVESEPVMVYQHDSFRGSSVQYASAGYEVKSFEKATGKKVLSWSTNGNVIDNLSSYLMSTNTALVATCEEIYTVTMNHVYDEVDWYEFKHPAFELINKETNAKYDMIYEGNVATAKVPAGVYDVAYVDGGYFEIDLNVSGNVILELFSFVTGMFDGSMDNPPLVVKQYDKPRNSTGGQVKYSSTSGVVKEFLERAGKKKVLSWSVNGEEIVLDDYWMGTNTALVATCSEFEDYTVTVNHHYDEVDWHTFAPLELKLVDKATKAEYSMTADGKTYSVKVPEGKYALYLADRLLYEITELSADTKYDIYSFVVGMFAENTDSAPVIKKQYDGIIRPELIIYGNRGPQVVAFEEATGKKVSSWSVNGSVIDLGNTTINSNTALVAAFEEVKPGNVHLVVYANGNTTKPVYQGTLDPQEYCEGTVIDLAELDINNYYSSRNGFESTGWMDDGRWNQYKSSGKANPLTELTVNGSWQNLQIMVTDYQQLDVKAVTNGNKDEAVSIYSGKVLHGTELIPYLNENVDVPEKTGYTADKWFNWDWYGHKVQDNKKITGWTNVYVTYTANKYNVSLDSGDGTVDPSSIEVTFDSAYGTLPTPVHANANYKFGGWYLGEEQVTDETVVKTAEDHTLTAKWDRVTPKHPGTKTAGLFDSNEKITYKCTTDGAHETQMSFTFDVRFTNSKNAQTCAYQKEPVIEWNEERGVFTSTIVIKPLEKVTYGSWSPVAGNLGYWQHYSEEKTVAIYYDAEIGKWKVDGDPVVIDCYHLTKPAEPTNANIEKATMNLLWLVDADKSSNYLKSTKLLPNTYTVSEMKENKDYFYVDITLTDLAPYVEAFNKKWQNGGSAFTLIDDKQTPTCTFRLGYKKLKPTSGAAEYKQDGTGFTANLTEYPDNSSKLNGIKVYVERSIIDVTVSFNAGEGNENPADKIVTYKQAYGELPTPVHANANYKFAGWFMTTEDGEVEVTAETIVLTKTAHTLTAKWDLPRPAYPKDGTNIQDDLYIVQCTTNNEHHITHNAFIYVNTSRPENNDLAYNEELGRWEITVQISLERFVNTTVTSKNYFGGMKHYMPDGQSIASNRRPSIKLYWDPTAEGETATGTPIVGMWKSVDASPVVINVMCLDKPAAPTISKLSGNMLWLRDCNNLRVYQKYTIKNLIADSYELGEMYKEGEDFYCELKVNVALYVDDFIAKKGEGYVLCNMNGHTSDQDKNHSEISAASYTLKLKYTGSKTDYKQDGTGWTVEYPTTSIKNNGYEVFLSNSFVVTFDAGEGNTVDPATKKVTYNTAYGELPTPVHANANYKFDGWFMTTADGEVEVTAETVVATKADHTLNAHWSLITPRDATASEIELFAKTITFKCVDCGSTVTLAELANSDLISVGEPVFVNGEFHRTLTINIAACAAKSSEALKTEENRNCEHTLAVAEATRVYTADTYSADLIWNPVTLEWTYNGEDITVELTSAKMKYQWLDHKNEVLYTTEQAVCLVANAPAFVGSVPDYTADNGHNFTFTSFTDGVESKDEATGQIIVTYTAQYSCTTRNVEFKDNIITVAKIIVDKNTPVTPDMYPAPPTPPYRHVFRCWRLDSQDADGNLVFVAVWDYDYSYTCTITYKDGSGEDQVYSNVMMGSRTPEFDGIPIREGYRFAGWSPNVSAFVNQFDVVYTAIWVKDDNSSSLTVDEIEVNEPVEATDTPVETDEPSETIPEVTVPEDKETNPETGLALSLLPMAAAALIVVIKRK